MAILAQTQELKNLYLLISAALQVYQQRGTLLSAAVTPALANRQRAAAAKPAGDTLGKTNWREFPPL